MNFLLGLSTVLLQAMPEAEAPPAVPTQLVGVWSIESRGCKDESATKIDGNGVYAIHEGDWARTHTFASVEQKSEIEFVIGLNGDPDFPEQLGSRTVRVLFSQNGKTKFVETIGEGNDGAKAFFTLCEDMRKEQ